MTRLGANPNGTPREQRRGQVIRRGAAVLTAAAVAVGIGFTVSESSIDAENSRTAAVSAPASPGNAPATPPSESRPDASQSAQGRNPGENDARVSVTDDLRQPIGVYNSRTGDGTIEHSAQQYAAAHGYDSDSLVDAKEQRFTNWLRTGTLRNSGETEASAKLKQPDYVPKQLPLSEIKRLYEAAKQ